MVKHLCMSELLYKMYPSYFGLPYQWPGTSIIPNPNAIIVPVPYSLLQFAIPRKPLISRFRGEMS